jgi:hypothetical protein
LVVIEGELVREFLHKENSRRGATGRSSTTGGGGLAPFVAAVLNSPHLFP